MKEEIQKLRDQAMFNSEATFSHNELAESVAWERIALALSGLLNFCRHDFTIIAAQQPLFPTSRLPPPYPSPTSLGSCVKCNTPVNAMGIDSSGGFHPGKKCREVIAASKATFRHPA